MVLFLPIALENCSIFLSIPSFISVQIFDFYDLEKAADYDGGFTAESKTIW